jgi:hypothetical protein
MTGYIDDGRQRRSARLRPGLWAAAIATALLASAWGSPAGASPPPSRGATGCGYLYWSYSTGAAPKYSGVIGRARLNGTHVDQKFIKTAQPDGPDDVVAGSGNLYWYNDYNIGRAKLNGTGSSRTSSQCPTDPVACPCWPSTPAISTGPTRPLARSAGPCSTGPT